MPVRIGSSRQASRAWRGWLRCVIHTVSATGSCHSAILGSPVCDSVVSEPLSWQESRFRAYTESAKEPFALAFFRKCSTKQAVAKRWQGRCHYFQSELKTRRV